MSSGGGLLDLGNSPQQAQLLKSASGNINSFFSSLVGGVVVAGIQLIVFFSLKEVLPRIYHPKSFLVSENQRVVAPPKGPWRWITSVFHTSNSEFIQKCGLDAYFFLRYLRMLLKIFVPLTCILGPILLCLNTIGGKGQDFVTGIYAQNNASDGAWGNIVGINQLAWGNVRPTNTGRYWGHCICALIVIVYCCYVFFDELQGYVRLRQAYLASPQHRLRASATTVLVSAIPRKWCTVEALEGLYDVFPGGVRNIWINRNFDELNEKVKRRDKIAGILEEAETNLIKMAKRAQMKQVADEAKKAGRKQTKSERKQEAKAQDEKAAAMAEGETGQSTNNPHQINQIDEEEESPGSSSASSSVPDSRHKPIMSLPIPVVGRGLEAVESGIVSVGKTIFGGIRNVGRGVENTVNTTQGLDTTTTAEDLTHQNTTNVSHHRGSSIPQDDGNGSSSLRLEPTNTRGQDSLPLVNSAVPAQGQPHSSYTLSKEDTHQLSRPQTASSDHIVHTVSLHGKTKWAPWRNDHNKIEVPAPYPHGFSKNGEPGLGTRPPPKMFWEFWREGPEPEEYPDAVDKDYDPYEGEPVWKRYLKPENRETMRLPIGGIEALGWIPFVGQKVDTIDYCREELARLNLEIEHDQQEPHKYPLMNSAFIQFNHQVAAHMACQSVSHHTAMHMAPRAVEIAPNDVIWNNMSIKWWERWLRTVLVITIVFWLIVGWAVPVGLTGIISNLDSLSALAPWLNWIGAIPDVVKNIIQGILPAALLALLLLLLPIILRALATLEGSTTGTATELSVQWYYFAFLFVQVFLIVTLTSSIGKILANLNGSITIEFLPNILATNLPSAANYFFNYIFLQAFSVSAGVLAQIAALFGWFVLAKLFDSTARQKWKRQVALPEVQWGTFYPVYTNFACIGLIYCTVAPLMLIFLLITFSFFWFVYRYQTLYITKFSQDTGGLLFPRAINQLFVGLYIMELCLFGLFLLVQEVNLETGRPEGTPCQGQAIVMVIALVLTLIYQILLNHSFGPLLQYLPITLEDDAVIRDEEFARAQDKRLRLGETDDPEEDINDVLKEAERHSHEMDEAMEADDATEIAQRRSRGLHRGDFNPLRMPGNVTKVIRGGWADRARSNQRSRSRVGNAKGAQGQKNRMAEVNAGVDRLIRQHRLRTAARKDQENGRNMTAGIADALFAGINDEIEDLTAEERDILIRRAFQHEALRARRPVIWIPRDDLGISDDEIVRTKKLSDHIWISNEHTGLDGKARVVYRKSPPDFSQLDLIAL